MTKEEAINVLNDYDINFERNTAEEIAEAHEMAIKAIRTIPSEDEKVIRIKKGTLKVRTGRYVIYDVEWLRKHFNTTEAKIYGQPNEDCISRKLMHDMGATCIAARNKDGDLVALGALDILPSVNLQPKTGHWIYSKAVNTGEIIWSKCSKCGNEERGCAQRMKYCPECGIKMEEVQQ